MSVYRDPFPSAPAAERKICPVCGLAVEALVDEELRASDPVRCAMLEMLAGTTARHGDELRCPGPPRVELVPVWRAVLELVAI